MPELPEVQTVVDTLTPLIVGQEILHLDLCRPDVVLPIGFDLAKPLVGAKVANVHRRGKRIILTMNDGNRFYIHLGMTGRLTYEQPAAPILPHTHLVIGFAENQIRFRDPRRFGGIWWLGRDQAPDENMGPEPLTLRTSELARRLSVTTRAIKNALLDQSVIAGLGNIYVDESLFKAAIHPLVPADKLSGQQVGQLNSAIKQTLRKALAHRGSTLRDYFDTNGNPGGFQKLHAVYDRAKLPCRRCKNQIERIVLGGDPRISARIARKRKGGPEEGGSGPPFGELAILWTAACHRYYHNLYEA